MAGGGKNRDWNDLITIMPGLQPDQGRIHKVKNRGVIKAVVNKFQIFVGERVATTKHRSKLVK